MQRKTVILDQGEFLGGAEHFLLDFLQSLSPQDIRRLRPVIMGGQSAEYQARLPEAVERIAFTLPPVKGGAGAKAKALWRLLWTARRLKQMLQTQEVTQIVTNTPRAHLTVLMLKKCWGWKGRWMVVVHDFTTKPASLVQQIGRRADVIIANSMPTRQWLRQQLTDSDHEKIRLIENGVTPTPSVEPVTELVHLINLGRLDRRKGQQFFVEAADLLHERNPDLRFAVIGDSVQTDADTIQYEAEIKQFAADRQLETLQFLPSVAKPLETINQYDALVFTPTEPETFGRVVIEALSLGKLVLAFDQTGPKEILQHYERWLKTQNVALPEPDLLLVETGNAMTLAERIAYFADNPLLVELYTKHAAAFVAENYNLEETKKRLLSELLD